MVHSSLTRTAREGANVSTLTSLSVLTWAHKMTIRLDWTKADAGRVLKNAREALRLTPNQVADAAGISEAHYFDLELYPEAVWETLSLNQVASVLRFLDISLHDLLPDLRLIEETPIAPSDLASVIAKRAEALPGGLSQFEDLAGWEVQGVLETPSRLFDFSIEAIIAISEAAHLNWRRVVNGCWRESAGRR